MDNKNNNNNNLNKSEIKTINKKIVLLIVTMVVIVFTVSFAYFTQYTHEKIIANVAVENTLNVNLVLSANSNLTLNVDPLVTYNDNIVARSVDNTDYAYLQNNSNYDDITCFYEIWYEATTTYHNSLTNTDNDLEFAIVGHDLSGQNPDFIFDLNNVTGTKKMADASIYTGAGVSSITQNWEFALEHYNLDVNQNEQMNHSYSGKIFFKDKGCFNLTKNVAKFINAPGFNIEVPSNNMYRFVGEQKDSDYYYDGYINNYICIGSDASDCPADNMYRIIGVVASNEADTGLETGMIKVIKNTSIGNYSYMGATDETDTNGTINYTNDSNYSAYCGTSGSSDPTSGCFPLWKDSYLNTNILNVTFLNSISSFSNLIPAVKWRCYVGYSTHALAEETDLCSNTATKISIMGEADYIASFNNGKDVLWYKNTVNTQVEYFTPWMKSSNTVPELTTGNDGRNKKRTDGSFRYLSYATSLDDGGLDSYYYYQSTDGGNTAIVQTGLVRPVFYLNNSVSITSGTGTYNDPFRINS